MIHRISILDENKSALAGEIRLFKEPVSMECVVDGEKIEVQATDYFDCLIVLREKLENRQWLILCNGARYDVYPSPELRKVGLGIKAYRMEIGLPAKTEDMVNILDETEIDKIGTIDEQKNYFEEWLQSLEELT